ncbi:MAG: recombinase family protein [Bacilli bacterium]
MNIETIEAKTVIQPRWKRVVAYARVSVEDERLTRSLKAQIQHYSDVIPATKGWKFAGVYSDEYITGTKSERPGFQKMMADCEAGSIDIILVKSISRLSRNTVDLLDTCRRLKNLGIEVRFEKENISTFTSDGELMLSLLASFAQEESRSISENVKWGIHKGFEKGHSTHYNVYGYQYNGKEYKIVPEQAEVIKQIYAGFLAGGTAEQLVKQFNTKGIPGPKGGSFNAGAVRRILTNLCYTGDSLLQREYIENHITHKRKKNTGELAMYLVEGTHPVIISKETYEAVQAELERRKVLGRDSEFYQRNWYTRKIYCGECGATMRHMDKAAFNGGRRAGSFVCRIKDRKGSASCCSERISERTFKTITAEVLDIDEFTPVDFTEKVTRVTIYKDHRMVYELPGGEQITKTWIKEGRQSEKRNNNTAED